MVARRMLPNGRAAGTAQVTPIGEMDPTAFVAYLEQDKNGKKLKDHFINGIEEAYTAYAGKGGILEHMNYIRQKEGGISKYIFNLSVECVRIAGNNLPMARIFFNAGCGVAEVHLTYKLQHKDDTGKPTGPLPLIKEVLPPWEIYKSKLLGGMKDGINPIDHAEAPEGARVDYNQLNAFQKARDALKSPPSVSPVQAGGTAQGAAQVSTITGNAGDSGEEGRTPRQSVLAEPVATWNVKLQSVWNILHMELRKLNDQGQEEAAKILNKAVANIQQLQGKYAAAAKTETTKEVEESDEIEIAQQQTA